VLETELGFIQLEWSLLGTFEDPTYGGEGEKTCVFCKRFETGEKNQFTGRRGGTFDTLGESDIFSKDTKDEKGALREGRTKAGHDLPRWPINVLPQVHQHRCQKKRKRQLATLEKRSYERKTGVEV